MKRRYLLMFLSNISSTCEIIFQYMSKDIFLRLSLLFSLSKNFEFWMPFYQDESINLSNFLTILDMDLYHRVSIEWKSPYKQSYTVNSH